MHKTGDTVTISPSLKDFNRNERPNIVPAMLETAGKQGKVVGVLKPEYAPVVYEVRVNGTTWKYLPKWLVEDELQIDVSIKDLQEILD